MQWAILDDLGHCANHKPIMMDKRIECFNDQYEKHIHTTDKGAWTETTGGRLVSQGKYGFCQHKLRNWVLEKKNVFCKDQRATCLSLKDSS